MNDFLFYKEGKSAAWHFNVTNFISKTTYLSFFLAHILPFKFVFNTKETVFNLYESGTYSFQTEVSAPLH